MTRSRIALVVLLSGALWVPASSVVAAGTCVSAPGTSGVDQYCETVPGAAGDRPSAGGSGSGHDGSVALPPATAAQLDRRSATDVGILALVAGGPAMPRGRKRDRDGTVVTKPGQASAADPGPSPSSDPLDAIPAALTDGPSVGAGLPLILVGIAALVGGIAWIRSRSTGR